MMPILLDLLTIFFILAGLFLLWLNLRKSRGSRVLLSEERDDSRDEF